MLGRMQAISWIRYRTDLRQTISKRCRQSEKGVEELRVWDEAGTFRIIYTARLADAVYVLHAFQKKTQATPTRDIAIAKARFAELMGSQK